MTKFKIIVFLCFSLFLTSCFSKTEEVEANDTPETTPVTVAIAPDPGTVPIKTDEQIKQEALLSEIMSANYINYEITSNKYQIPKKIVNLINDNLLEFVTLNKDNFPNKAEKNQSEDSILGETDGITEIIEPQVIERVTPLIDDNLDYDVDSATYAKRMFPEYTILARSKFVSSSVVSYKYIKSFGAYIDSNFIFIKKIYDYSLGKYIYDILFLNGDINNSSNPWYRHAAESRPIEDTLADLKITDLNSYINIVEQNKLPALIKAKELASHLENNNDSYTSEESADDSMESLDTSGDTNIEADTQNSNNESDTQGSSEENADANTEQETTSAELVDQSTDEIVPSIPVITEEEKLEAIDIQKRLIAFRVEKIVGFWQDIHSNEVYSIKEIASSSKTSRKYGAYIILDSDPAPLKENVALNWINEDLKFDFSVKNQGGVFMNKEKMPTLVKVIPYPAKGTLALFLPNKEVRYLVPMIPSLDQEVYNDVYSEILKIQPAPANYSKQYDALTKYSTSLPETKSSDYLFLSWTLPLGIVLLSLAFL